MEGSLYSPPFTLQPDCNHPKGSKDPNNRVPFKGVIMGYVRIVGDYRRVYRTQIIGLQRPNTINIIEFEP